MRRPGAVALGDVAAKASHLEIACSRCKRHGRYQLARLVERLGADFAMTDLGDELTNCPRRNVQNHNERCDVYFPTLIKIMGDE